MDALTLTPVEQSSPRWSETLSTICNGLVERFHSAMELPTEGTMWPIAIATGLFLLLVLGIYLTGWDHIAAGP